MAQLPPLNALRTFEAAARHLSFTAAAEELHVTQAAVSHQVRTLEDWFGFPLFLRAGRQISLTEEGALLQPAVAGALAQIGSMVQQLVDGGETGAVTVSTMYTFASTWLVPKLKRFRAAHPEIDVRVTTNEAVIDFRREDVDLAIRYGGGSWPDVEAHWLTTEDIFPVCSPELLETKPLNEPQDLARHTLIHDDHEIGWAIWLAAAEVKGVDPARGPFYQSTALTIQSALDCEGVILGRSAIVADLLASGRLVRPFDLSLPDEYAYYVVYPPGADRLPKVRMFCDWLYEEAGVDRQAEERADKETAA